MRLVIALGGNAIVSPEGSTHPQAQVAALRGAAGHLARLLAHGHELVLTHGNGPQVGNVLVKQEVAASVLPPVALDWCGAMTQATIGFELADALEDELRALGMHRSVVAVVTRTLVELSDSAFARPTKPIGRFVERETARAMMESGVAMVECGPRGWRRVVASPEPVEIVDSAAILALLERGFVVVCNGGGGIPVVRTRGAATVGVEAVIDKDLGAVLVGHAAGADTLVIATDVDRVMVDWGTVNVRPLVAITAGDLRDLAAQGQFAEGSMGPKVEAACRFVEGGGGSAVICAMSSIVDALEGRSGTLVTAS